MFITLTKTVSKYIKKVNTNKTKYTRANPIHIQYHNIHIKQPKTKSTFKPYETKVLYTSHLLFFVIVSSRFLYNAKRQSLV